MNEYIPVEDRTLLMDGTFKVVPTGPFKQLLIIYIEVVGSVSICICRFLSISFDFLHLHFCSCFLGDSVCVCFDEWPVNRSV